MGPSRRCFSENEVWTPRAKAKDGESLNARLFPPYFLEAPGFKFWRGASTPKDGKTNHLRTAPHHQSPSMSKHMLTAHIYPHSWQSRSAVPSRLYSS